jgi:signal peptidase I
MGPTGWRRLTRALKEIALVVAVVMAARTAVAEPYYVPSGSMEPTLAVGDRLLVDKFSYGYSRFSLPSFPNLASFLPARDGRLFGKIPERGDVVVFRLPRDPSQSFVKRVIGLPGDKVQLRQGSVWLNGVAMVRRPADAEIMPGAQLEALSNGREYSVFERSGWGQFDDTREVEVPPGHIFVMGDNRDDSLDSRAPGSLGGVGLVPVENLTGRVDLVLASWEMGITSRPLSEWPAAVRFGRFFSWVR